MFTPTRIITTSLFTLLPSLHRIPPSYLTPPYPILPHHHRSIIMSKQQQQTAHTGSGPFGYSLSQYQDLIDSTPSLQPRGHVNGSQYGWVPGTKGVWVLEAPTDEQCARLRSLPPTDDPEVFNARLRDVGAVFYADYVCFLSSICLTVSMLNRPFTPFVVLCFPPHVSHLSNLSEEMVGWLAGC